MGGRSIEGSALAQAEGALAVALEVEDVALACGLVNASDGTVGCWHGSLVGGAAALSSVTIHDEWLVPGLVLLPLWLHGFPAIVENHTASCFCGPVWGQLLLMASVLITIGGSRDAVGV